MSSSNRTAGPCEAVVTIAGRATGSIRLPDHRRDDFVDHFNRTYGQLGLRLQPIQDGKQQVESDSAESAATASINSASAAEQPKKSPPE